MNKLLLQQIGAMSAEQLYETMFCDPLTGVLNRRAFETENRHEGMAIVDLDSLKWVNDTHGHRKGDGMLVWLANLLVRHFGANNVYRLAGDEFAVYAAGRPSISSFEGTLLSLQATYDGFSVGMGTRLESADNRLRANKEFRERTGLRAPRGERPPWADRVPA